MSIYENTKFKNTCLKCRWTLLNLVRCDVGLIFMEISLLFNLQCSLNEYNPEDKTMVSF